MFRLPDPITEQRLYEAQRDLSPLNRESLKTDVVHDSSNTKEIFSKEVLNNTNYYNKHKVKIQKMDYDERWKNQILPFKP